jgi:hypothetical protein
MIPNDLKVNYPCEFFSDIKTDIGFTSSAAERSKMLYRLLQVTGMDVMNENRIYGDY